MLKLVRDEAANIETCPTCLGRGSVIQPDTMSVRSGVNGFNLRGAIKVPGGRVPCPKCEGRKVVERPPLS